MVSTISLLAASSRSAVAASRVIWRGNITPVLPAAVLAGHLGAVVLAGPGRVGADRDLRVGRHHRVQLCSQGELVRGEVELGCQEARASLAQYNITVGRNRQTGQSGR